MPVPTKIKKNIGVQGVADVRVLQKALRIVFADGDQYEVEKGDWDRPSGKYNVTLSTMGDKILFVSPPPSSTCLVRFVGFGNRQNEIPEPYIKRGGPRKGKNGSSWFAPDELTFSAKLEVVDKSPYNGLSIPYSLPYAFEQYPGTNTTMITAAQTRLIRIEEFLRITGLDLATEDIPFSDNVLPWLERRLTQTPKIFSVSLNDKGFIQNLVDIPDYLLPPELTGKPKKAKATKKSK